VPITAGCFGGRFGIPGGEPALRWIRGTGARSPHPARSGAWIILGPGRSRPMPPVIAHLSLLGVSRRELIVEWVNWRGWCAAGFDCFAGG
jgi:hypothetical protein